MAAGFAMGPLFKESPRRRQQILVALGVAAVIAFIGLRWLNGYGDPTPWSVETRPGYTLLSFLRVRKYPPSLDYLLMTLGPVLIALAGLEHARGRVFSFFVTYGRVPLFFYVAHIYLAHLITVAVAYGQGGPAHFLFTSDGAVAAHPPAWPGLRSMGLHRDRALPSVPGFRQGKGSSPGLVVELLIGFVPSARRTLPG